MIVVVFAGLVMVVIVFAKSEFELEVLVAAVGLSSPLFSREQSWD